MLFVADCDQAKFHRSVSRALGSVCGGLILSTQLAQTFGSSSSIVTEFLTGLETYLKVPHRLKWCLLYTETAPDCDVATRGSQDSLIRNLLNIDVLQPRLVILLTDTLLTLAYEQSVTWMVWGTEHFTFF